MAGICDGRVVVIMGAARGIGRAHAPDVVEGAVVLSIETGGCPDDALCLHAGAASIYLGDRLLTTEDPGAQRDTMLLRRLDAELATGPLLG